MWFFFYFYEAFGIVGVVWFFFYFDEAFGIVGVVWFFLCFDEAVGIVGVGGEETSSQLGRTRGFGEAWISMVSKSPKIFPSFLSSMRGILDQFGCFVSIFPTILGAVEWLSPELVLDLVVSTPQIWIATAAGAYDFLQK